ncbi:MAG: DNA internalization-related competence protein ComEC/Rec2, partial [Desulfohalobiaceae bacterium]|nr:DNA internalization-related competence protein ComEC/Rec2 [Desulfohalobiaceae bacterium]
EGPGQGLLLALLMGDRSKSSYQTLDLVRRASLAHSLALSGLHLGFVVSLAYGLAWLAGRVRPSLYLLLPRHKLAILTAVPLVLAYLWLGQARPSLLRAALMFFFWGFLIFRGRSQVFGDGICFALLLILAANPLSVHDLGLQLSMVAVAGIVVYLPLFMTWIKGLERKIGRCRGLTPVLVLLAVSLIANLVLLPLMVGNFGELSPHLYFNLLWLPLLGCVVLPLGLIGLGLSLLPGLSPVGGLLILAGAQVLEGMVWILQLFEHRDWLFVFVPLRPLWPQMLGYFILLISLPRCWNRIGDLPKWIPVCGLLLLLAPGLARTAGGLKDSVRLELIDVGQGQAVLLEAGEGKRLLLDGGGSWNREYDLGRFILSPALTRGKSPILKQVVLSHDDYDHLRGLFYILKHYRVEEFLYNGNWPEGEDGRWLREIIEDRGIGVRRIKAGDNIRLRPGLGLQVLHPPAGYDPEKDNDRSLVFRLCHEDRGLALLPGDVEKAGLDLLCANENALQSEVLLIPHHGSRSSFYPELYTRVEPDLALVSCGYLNLFHFPHEAIQDFFKQRRVPLFSTAENGQIIVDWDLANRKRSLVSKIQPRLLKP